MKAPKAFVPMSAKHLAQIRAGYQPVNGLFTAAWLDVKDLLHEIAGQRRSVKLLVECAHNRDRTGADLVGRLYECAVAKEALEAQLAAAETAAATVAAERDHWKQEARAHAARAGYCEGQCGICNGECESLAPLAPPASAPVAPVAGVAAGEGGERS